MPPPHRRVHREIPAAACPSLAIGAGIVAAQMATLIGGDAAYFWRVDVRFGSKADMCSAKGHVRSTCRVLLLRWCAAEKRRTETAAKSRRAESEGHRVSGGKSRPPHAGA